MSDSISHATDCVSACPLAAAAATPRDVSRRTFLSASMLAAAAAALAACGAGGGDGATAPSSLSGTLTIADFPALASVGGIATTTFDGAPIAIVRTDTSSFVVVSRICTHEGATVNSTGSGFLCPRHGARFSATGSWIGGQRTSSLATYPATYDPASGTLSLG